jgi:hypothetical protein
MGWEYITNSTFWTSMPSRTPALSIVPLEVCLKQQSVKDMSYKACEFQAAAARTSVIPTRVISSFNALSESVSLTDDTRLYGTKLEYFYVFNLSCLLHTPWMIEVYILLKKHVARGAKSHAFRSCPLPLVPLFLPTTSQVVQSDLQTVAHASTWRKTCFYNPVNKYAASKYTFNACNKHSNL